MRRQAGGSRTAGSLPQSAQELAARLSPSNMKREAVAIEITCHVGGKVDRASDGGKVTLGAFDSGDWANYRGSPEVNNHSTVFWRATVEPGKIFAPTATYHYFTRH